MQRKPLLKKLKWTLPLLLSSGLLSCATPPDVPVCVDFHDHGQCVYTMSGKQILVDNDRNLYPIPLSNGELPTWDELKAVSLVVPAASSWAPIKTYILDECKQNNNCGPGFPTQFLERAATLEKLLSSSGLAK